MFLLSKKRIGIILTSILIGIFAFSFKIASTEKNTNTNNTIGGAVQVVATPVSGKTIVVDARSWSTR